MHEAQPSRTALRVALRRAAHQLHDAQPLVFADPLAVRILGLAFATELARTPAADRKPFSAALRARMVVRARFAEDVLAEGVREQGVRQCIVLGAGLDTFAYRNPWPQLRVFEVDHPATQAWKLEMLRNAGIAVPENVRHVPVDFERQSLARELATAGFDPEVVTATAWLGVAPYLTSEAFAATLSVLGKFAPRSSVVFDYGVARELLSPVEQLMVDSLGSRVAQAGEPFRLTLRPEDLRRALAEAGLALREDLGRAELNARYFAGRIDGLEVRGSTGRLCHAEAAG